MDERSISEIKKRLEAGSCPEALTGCILWTKSCNHKKNGYGQMEIFGVFILAHRAAYEAYVGPIPKGLLVRHKCDVSHCINPDHLETGTSLDNTRDMFERARNPPRAGEASGRKAKFTNASVAEYRRRFRAGETQRALAREAGVGVSAFSRMIRGVTWFSVPRLPE